MLDKLPRLERRLTVDWLGAGEFPSNNLTPIATALGIQLQPEIIQTIFPIYVDIHEYAIFLNNEALVRCNAILMVHCNKISLNGQSIDIHVLGEKPEIPITWRNCIFYTNRGLDQLSSAFVHVLFGWADNCVEISERGQLLQALDGHLLFGNEHIRLAQERVLFDLQHPPLERGRILWIFANPYVDLLAGPYGLEILDGFCRESGFVTRITNPFIEFLDPIEGLKHLLKRFQPDMIGISLRNIDDALIIHSLEGAPESVDTLDLLADVKHLIDSLRSFERPIFIGGAAFSTAPDQFLPYFQLEFGVVGAGEAAIQQLCALWDEGFFQREGMAGFRKVWSELPSAVWMEHGVCRYSSAQAQQTRLLEQSPLVRRTWAYAYKNKRDYMPEPVRSSQGCALGCSYCIESVNRKSMSWRPVQHVVDEIEFAFRQYGIRVFHLADSEANIPFQRFVDFAETLIARNLHEEVLWTAYLNVKPFDTQAIPLLHKSGLYRFKFAFDHFSDDMLRSYHKNFREKDLERLLAGFAPYQGQLQLYAGILLGGPGETEETLQYAVRRMKEHTRKGWTFYYNVGVRVYPGTPFGQSFLAFPEASSYYGPGKADAGMSPLVYCTPQAPRLLARRLEKTFASTPRVFRMNKERTLAIGYEGFRRFMVAWHAWLDGRYQEAAHVLAETEGLHLLREGVVLQRLLKMRERYARTFSHI